MSVYSVVAMVLLGTLLGGIIGAYLSEQSKPEPIQFANVVPLTAPEVAEWADAPNVLPGVADQLMVWADVQEVFDRFDAKMEAVKTAALEPSEPIQAIEPPHGGDSPTLVPFVPEVPRSSLLTGGNDLLYCYAPVHGVVHHRACLKAPHEENRKYLWAFSPAEAVEWVQNEADGGQSLRPCQTCKPFVLPEPSDSLVTPTPTPS